MEVQRWLESMKLRPSLLSQFSQDHCDSKKRGPTLGEWSVSEWQCLCIYHPSDLLRCYYRTACVLRTSLSLLLTDLLLCCGLHSTASLPRTGYLKTWLTGLIVFNSLKKASRSQPTSILLCTQGPNRPAKISICSCFSNSPEVGNINQVASFLSMFKSHGGKMLHLPTACYKLLLVRQVWCMSALPNHQLPPSSFDLLCSLLPVVPGFGWSGSVLFPRTTGYFHCATMLCMNFNFPGETRLWRKAKGSSYTWQIWMSLWVSVLFPSLHLFD